MATLYRTLLPAPAANGQPSVPATPLQSTAKSRANQACQLCRDKRRKCPGQRPQCGECALRQLRCVYEAAPGQTRMAALRNDNERMKNDLDKMMKLYRYLQTQPKEEVGEALLAIQTGASPSEVMETIKNGTSRTSSSDATPDSSSARTTPAKSDSSERWRTPSSTGLPQQSSSPASSHGSLPITDPMQLSSGSPSSKENLLLAIESLRKGTMAFFLCTGCIFHIYDQTEAQKMFDGIRPYLESGGESWLELVFRGSTPSELKPALCSLCIMAAIGLQYQRNPIPAIGFEASGTDGSYKYVSLFYESARHLLEAVIELDVMEAIKVCAALCVFNTIGHATIAMSYADMGINFVVSIGPTLNSTIGGLESAAWVEFNRVTRTLVTLRSWLVSTLGYVHREDSGLQAGLGWPVDSEDMSPNETIQHHLNKVVQIEANLLRTIKIFSEVSPALLASTQWELAQWHEQLPSWMHLSAFIEPSESTCGFRRAVFLVHLFYLSASILLARLAHGRQRPPPLQYEAEETRMAATNGVYAARTAARILQLKIDEEALFQRCWCCEFAAYISALMLLHSVAQMQLHNYPQAAWQQELSYAQSCLSVLEHRAKVDPVADRFAQVISGYYDSLATEYQLDVSYLVEAPANHDYLFSVPLTAPPQIAETARSLLNRISSPFDSPSNLHERSLKAGIGVHTTMLFNHDPCGKPSSWSAAEAALLGMQTGRFVGSPQPHGWDIFLDLNKM